MTETSINDRRKLTKQISEFLALRVGEYILTQERRSGESHIAKDAPSWGDLVNPNVAN